MSLVSSMHADHFERLQLSSGLEAGFCRMLVRVRKGNFFLPIRISTKLSKSFLFTKLARVYDTDNLTKTDTKKNK